MSNNVLQNIIDKKKLKIEKIKNEISITSGHEYKVSSVTAKTGKNEF
mgnify:CR=1 FL=1